MFATTRWSLVHAAGGLRSSVAREALGTLCETYWYPLYAYARRRGCAPPDAEDRVQAFFAGVLTDGVFAAADPSRGRFRSFLLKSFQNFLHAEHRRDAAIKRGGGRTVQSLDAAQAEERYRLEPAESETPERLFERNWALTLLQTTLSQVQGEYAEKGQGKLYAALEAHLRQDREQLPYAELATSLGLTEEAVKSAAHRLRKRYRELLRSAIADTLADAGDVDDELRLLLRAVAGAV
uniref:Sigma-70 family RNA polymerase sigma factor n=1 Tax=Schlesneria paludicola TaxID=360056 RepID=A0A7C2JZT4_9PLAN